MTLVPLAGRYARSRPLLAMSALAISLGVGVLYTVQAVVHGYLLEVETTLRDFSGDVVVHAASPRLTDNHLQRHVNALLEVEEASTIEPQLNWFGLVGRRGSQSVSDPRSSDLAGLLLVGVEPGGLLAASADQTLPGTEQGSILLGQAAAEKFGVERGDSLEVVTFHRGSWGKPVPSRRSFLVAGTFTTGRYDADLDRALVLRDDLAEMVGHASGWSQIIVRGKEGVLPEDLALSVQAALQKNQLSAQMPGQVTTWRDAGGNFLRAVESQKGILQSLFFLVVLVAAYQLVATLTLTIAEKRRDMGVLGALGAAPQKIVSFFVSLGVLVALLGSLGGIALGSWLTANLSTVEKWLGGGEPIFTAEVYKFDHIPVAVDSWAVVQLVLATLSVALMFSLLPAWRAARMPIVKALEPR